MTKRFVIAVILILTMAVTGTTMAASASFNDVPTTHWAYSAVNELVKSGIIDGYSDGTYRGNKAITRYEFAIMITKALENYDKADAANKGLIDKLSVEFATELNTLGTRITKVENKIGTFKLNGDARFRYEYASNPNEAIKFPLNSDQYPTVAGNPQKAREKVVTRERYRLMLNSDVAPNLSVFSLVVFSGSGSGSFRTNNPSVKDGDGGSANPSSILADIDAVFATYKAQDGTVYKFGRNLLFLGQGLLWDVAHSEGVQVTFGNKLRTMIGTQAFIGKEWYFADMKYDLNPNLQLTAAHIQDKQKDWYNSTAVGFIYKGIPNLKISSEVGQNDNANINVFHNRPGKVKAGNFTVKYGEAKRDQVGSSGVWVTYKKAQKGFDTQYASTWTYFSPYPGGLADNLKGFEFGYEYTPFKNGLFQIMYDPLKTDDGTNGDRKFLISQLIFKF